MGLEARGRGGTKKKEKKEEKIPHMCESIGHRPLRGRCPKSGKTRISAPARQSTTGIGRVSGLVHEHPGSREGALSLNGSGRESLYCAKYFFKDCWPFTGVFKIAQFLIYFG